MAKPKMSKAPGMKKASHSESLMKKQADGKHATEHHATIMKTPGHGKRAGSKSSKAKY